MLYQRTLRAPIHAIGIGVHSGIKVRATLRPAEVNTGIRFRRVDTHTVVRACASNIVDSTLATTLGEGDVTVSTVEHLMAALWGCRIDNALIEIDGPEVPILDGSAAPWVDLIEAAGTRALPAPRRFIRMRQSVRVSDGVGHAELSPGKGFTAAYTFVARHPVYDTHPRHVEVDFDTASFGGEIAGARSFGLVRDLKSAQAHGRCRASSLVNAVGIDDAHILNPEGLRYDDEFAKHKLLDALGDLYLLGLPVLGRFTGHKSGHALNRALVMAVRERADAWDLVEGPDDRPLQLAVADRPEPIILRPKFAEGRR